MVYRLSDKSMAREAKSSAGRSRRPRNRLYRRQDTSSSDAPESTSDSSSSSSDPSPSSSSDAPMTTRTTSMPETSSSHATPETSTSSLHSMVDPSTTAENDSTSSRAGPSSTSTPVHSTSENVPTTSTHTPSESSSTPSTSNPPLSTDTPRQTTSINPRTTQTTTPLPTTITPSQTSPTTSDVVATPSPTSSSDPPNTPSTSSSRLTTTTPPPPSSSSSSPDGSNTSITTPASSSRTTLPTSETTPISTDPISTPPASNTLDPTSSTDPEPSSSSPVSETRTTPGATTTPVATPTSTPQPVITPTGSESSAVITSAPVAITSGSVIFSSASDIEVSFTTTNSLGQLTTEIPSLYTTTFTSTSNGVPLTITAVVSQATTLNTDGGGSMSPFFKNKGAVAGVFIVVGIAGAAIILFGIFTCLRRRKMRRLTREAAIAATLGSGRTPFVDDDDADASGPSGGNSTEMGYHSASDTRPLYGTYGPPYGMGGVAYGYGSDPFYSNPPAGKSFNASPPGSIDQHGPAGNNPQGLLSLVPYSYGATGGPNLPPTTPLLSNGTTASAAVPPASPPSVYSNINAPKGYEYDYSNYIPPSALDGAGRTFSPSPTSPTFSKRSSLPPPPPGAAVPNYAALAAAAGLASDPLGTPMTNLPPSAYQGAAPAKARRNSNTPSFASSASRYSADSPAADSGFARSQTPGLPTYSVANLPPSQSGHSFNASSSNHSHGGPSTPGPDAVLSGDRGGLIRSASGGSDWKAGGRPETPLIDHRLDPSILAAKGRSPINPNRLSDYSTPSEESLGSLQDHEDYSRRVLQVTNPS